MKKLLTLILILIFAASSLVYTSAIFGDKASEEISSSIVQSQIETQVNRLVKEVNSVFPMVEDANVDILLKKIENDPQTSELIDNYTRLLVKDLAQNENNVVINMNQDIKDILHTHTDEFSGLFANVVYPDYIDGIVTGLIDKVDVTGSYYSILEKIDDKLSDKESKVLKMLDFYYENIESVRNTALLLSISSFVFALVLNLSLGSILWVFVLGSLTSLLAHASTHFIITMVFTRFLGDYKLNIDYGIFKRMEMILLLVFVFSIILKALTQNLTRKKATYE